MRDSGEFKSSFRNYLPLKLTRQGLNHFPTAPSSWISHSVIQERVNYIGYKWYF